MVNQVELTTDIPIPRPRNKYPYESMEVGDSFLVTGVQMQLICNYNYRAKKRLNRVFTARLQEDGVRVWRVA